MSLIAALLAIGAPQAYRKEFPLPGTRVPDGWGVNIHFTDEAPGEVDKIADAGFRWVRMDFFWSAIERERGTYDFSSYDRLMAALARRKIRPLFILDYGNDLYQVGAPRSPEARAAFCRFVEAAVKRYGGKGVVWEMWNEPNIGFWKPQPNVDEYILLAQEVGKTIRMAAPQEWYVGPATSGFDWAFLQKCFDAGLLEQFDAVTVHPYRTAPPETVRADWMKLRDLVDAKAPKGKQIPLISGEWGYSELYEGMSKERQGHYVPRQYLANLAAGVGLSIWYDWKDDGTDPKEVEHHFGTVSPDLTPKPGYLAAKQLAGALDGYTFHLELAQPAGSHLLAFRKGSNVKLVGWSQAADGMVQLPRGPKAPVGPEPQFFSPTLDASRAIAEHPGMPASIRDERSFRQAMSILAKDARAVSIRDGNWRRTWPTTDRPPFLDDLSESEHRLELERDGVAIAVVVPPLVGFKAVPHLAQDGSRKVQLSHSAASLIEATLGGSPFRIEPGQSVSVPYVSSSVRVGNRSLSLGEVRALGGTFDSYMEGDAKIAGSIQSTRVDGAGDAAGFAIDVESGWKYALIKPRSHEPLPGKPKWLSVWVWSEGGGDQLRARFTDATGQTFQPDFGPMDWKGWRLCTFALDVPVAGRWGGANDGVIHYPIHIDSVAVIDASNRPGKRKFAIGTVSIAIPPP